MIQSSGRNNTYRHINEMGITVSQNNIGIKQKIWDVMPITILSRYMLQYSKSIDDAEKILDDLKDYPGRLIFISSKQSASAFEFANTEKARINMENGFLALSNHARIIPSREIGGGSVKSLSFVQQSNIPNLTSEVTTAVKELAPFVDSVLLGYGLCGNALKNTNELFKDIPVPVSLPMENEYPVDDCVGLIIGGRNNYYAEQCLCAGTMFMNAGFSRYWEKILAFDVPDKLLHKKDKIVKRIMGNYKRSLLLSTTVLGEDQLRKNTKEFNEKYGLKIETRPGT